MQNEPLISGAATYSPDDNKIRLYPVARLHADLYARVKAAGFKYAPKQQLFVAPMWTPEREDLAIELLGELEDEDKSLVARAEERAERFEDYSESRAEDAERARQGVSAIADNIPLGQPILVGHHSEKRARRDAEKIENGMRRACKMWDTSKYWISRAKGAIRSAKYKERPDVRARRIKTIEADRRRFARSLIESQTALERWSKPGLTKEEAVRFAGIGSDFYLPRKEGDRPDFAVSASPYDALTERHPTLYAPRSLEEVIAAALAAYPPRIERLERWIAHCDNRLAYENAMLADQGASELLEPKARPSQLPLCNYRSGSIAHRNKWSKGELVTIAQVEITSAEYAAIHADYKGTEIVDNSHRVRVALAKFCKTEFNGAGRIVAVFLTDSKTHDKPGAVAPRPAEPPPIRAAYTPPAPDPTAEAFNVMKDQLKAGVQIVAADQLFPTPPAIADRMVDLANIEDGHSILEPSAGTGAIIDAIRRAMIECHDITAIEINPELAHRLRSIPGADSVRCACFLECLPEATGRFDRILMNPPFSHGADIKHVEHARKFLKPGGMIVAVMANGPRQQEYCESNAFHCIDLPAQSFASQGTGVSTRIVIIHAPKPIEKPSIVQRVIQTAAQLSLF